MAILNTLATSVHQHAVGVYFAYASLSVFNLYTGRTTCTSFMYDHDITLKHAEESHRKGLYT